MNKTELQNQIAELQAQLQSIIENEKHLFDEIFGSNKEGNFIMRSDNPQFDEFKSFLIENATKQGQKYIDAAELGELVVWAAAKKKLGQVDIFLKGTKWGTDTVRRFDVATLTGCELIEYKISEYILPQDRNKKPEVEKVEDLEVGTNILAISNDDDIIHSVTEDNKVVVDETSDPQEWERFLKDEGLDCGKYDSIEEAFEDLESDLK